MTIPIDTTSLDFEEPSGRFLRAPPPPEAATCSASRSAVDYEARWTGSTGGRRPRQRLRLRRRDAHRDGVPGGPRAARRRARRRLHGARRPAARVGAQRARPPDRDRVYGPDLMDRACARAARSRARASTSTAAATRARSSSSRRTCAARFPGLQIVGGYAPPFRDARRRRGGRDRRRHQPLRRRRRVGRDRRAQAGEVDGARCARGSTRPCWSASAPRSTSTPA